MPGLLMQIPATFRASGTSPLPSGAIPPYEAAFLGRDSINEVWSADIDYDVATGLWKGRRKDSILRPDLSLKPPLVPNVIGTRPGLNTANNNYRLTDLSGQAFLPIGASWTVWGVWHPGGSMGAANWSVFGNATASYFSLWRRFDNNKMAIYHAGVQLGITAAGLDPTKPFYGFVSHNAADKRYRFWCNGAELINVTAATVLANDQLVLGNVRASGSATAAGADPKYVLEVGQSLLPWGETANAAEVTAFSAYIAAKYSGVTWG